MTTDSDTLGQILTARGRAATELHHLLRAVTAEFQETSDLARALCVVVELLGRSLGAQRVYIELAHDSSSPSERISEWTSDEAVALTDPAPTASSGRFGSLLDHASHTGRAVVFNDVAMDERLLPSDVRSLVRMEVRAALVFPLVDDGTALGAVVVYDTTGPRHWDSAHVDAVETVGREVLSAVKRSRALELERDLVLQTRALDNERSEFVASVSHELRSPLTSILGYLELLREGELGEFSDEQAAVLRIIERNGRQLLGLIEDLLAVASVERSSFGSLFAPVDVRTIIDAVAQTIAVRLREGGLALRVDVDEHCHALGDAEQLERAVLNLATNAVKFTPPGGTIHLAARREGPLVRIEVTDTGIGISAADQQHIFDRFFRATQDGKKPPSGTGLGLFIVKTIVETHGGTLDYESEPDVGTRIACLLPAALTTTPGPSDQPQENRAQP